MLGGGAVSWSSKKQSLTAQSTVESEYISLSFAVREAMWLRKVANEMRIGDLKSPTLLHVDNQGCMSMAKSGGMSEKTKHIDVKFHFIKRSD